MGVVGLVFKYEYVFYASMCSMGNLFALPLLEIHQLVFLSLCLLSLVHFDTIRLGPEVDQVLCLCVSQRYD